MSATMTAPMPSLNGSTPERVYAAKVQATSLRESATSALAFLKAKFNAALAWAGARLSTVWGAIKGFASAHATTLSIAAAAGMSVRGVSNAVMKGATTATSWVAKAALTTGSYAVKGARWLAHRLGDLVGVFSAPTGDKVHGFANRTAASALNGISTAHSYVDGTKQVADNVLTAPTTSNIINTGAAALTGAIAVNYFTGGAVAGMVVSLPVVGFALANIVTGGLFTLAAIFIGLPAAGAVYTLFFNKGVSTSIPAAVHASAEVIQGEALWADATAETVTDVAVATVVAAEAAAQGYDPQIDVVGLEAYTAQTAAIKGETEALKVLAAEVSAPMSHKGKGKGRRS